MESVDPLASDTSAASPDADLGLPAEREHVPAPVGATSVAAVDRAVDILLLFGRSLHPSLGVTEIAQELGMPKSGVHRVLSTLRNRRLVTYDADTRKYTLGQAAIALSQSYVTRLDVQGMAAETLESLMQSTNETATLAVRRHGSLIYRAQSLPDHELRLEVRLARTHPLHVSASGKAFLAFLPDDETRGYLDRVRLEPDTVDTITDVAVLRAQLDRIRSTGVATSCGERLAGVSSIAAPVLDYDGYPVCVVAVSGPSARVDVGDAALAALVGGAARELSEEMGHRLS
jgi:DNA-binding IclR family transcriptional regulator